jgi:starch synthase
MSQRQINILFLASEADPFVKIGGLGDVAGSLPPAIQNLSNDTIKYDIRLALPFYGVIKKKLPNLPKMGEFPLHTGGIIIQTSIFEYTHRGIPVYFIDGAPIKEEDPVYGSNFVADSEKFVFFSLACLELPRFLKWRIDILHANDWHTAVAIHQLSTQAVFRQSSPMPKKILTLHNLPFMGAGSEDALTRFGIEPADDPHLPTWARTIPLPMGLASADRIVPVSRSYAQEILTPEFGCGLESFFKSHSEKIWGIINGIDNTGWDPASDKFITSNFNVENLSGKISCKNTLLTELGLNLQPRTPLIVLISRMDQQKGVDLAINSLRMIENLRWQAIILGSGDSKLESAAMDLENSLPEKVRAKILFDSALSHRMYAGADILLMPSRYEPCGLSQLIAMRYGTLPVARATGGLKDTIRDVDKHGHGTGFLFSEASANETVKALKRSMEAYMQQERWNGLIRNAMDQDFSWNNSAKEYCALYQQLIEK